MEGQLCTETHIHSSRFLFSVTTTVDFFLFCCISLVDFALLPSFGLLFKGHFHLRVHVFGGVQMPSALFYEANVVLATNSAMWRAKGCYTLLVRVFGEGINFKEGIPGEDESVIYTETFCEERNSIEWLILLPSLFLCIS
jgi:hypothetical protein